MAKKETTPKAATVGAEAAAKVAADILEANPGMNEVHVTSDGTAFYTRNDAQNHANSLKNREVYSHKREAAARSKKGASAADPAKDPERDELTGEVIAEENDDNPEDTKE